MYLNKLPSLNFLARVWAKIYQSLAEIKMPFNQSLKEPQKITVTKVQQRINDLPAKLNVCFTVDKDKYFYTH